MDAIIQRYKQVCPLVIVQSSRDNLDLVRSRWALNPTSSANPDIVLAPQTWLIEAVDDGITLRDISNLISNEQLQRYHPAALNGMRVHNRLVGVPMTMHVYALYYNHSLIEAPAAVLERLRSQADNGVPIALPARFIPAFWGVGAQGGTLFDSQNRVILDQGGFAEWLTWLRRSRDEHGIQLIYEQSELKSLFWQANRSLYRRPAEAPSCSRLSRIWRRPFAQARLRCRAFFEATGFSSTGILRTWCRHRRFRRLASNADNQALAGGARRRLMPPCP